MSSPAEIDSVDSILVEQCREIDAAKTLDADENLAFNLQMQEAVAASLSLTPCASTSSQPPPPDDMIFVENDEVFDYTALLVEDIARLDQERLDREACEKLMREIKEDLDRRIHDQKVAGEIMSIPNIEWEKDGDHFNRPYTARADASSSSSSSAVEFALLSSESFRLYCKGLESEERIRDMKVIVGGIGVAICDSRDNLIFEVRKGLEVGADGGKSAEGVVAGMEALAEGLSTALNLDLKKVIFFCDNSVVYNLVTGRVESPQSKISTLVNQVSLLQKKFAECKPSLVVAKDVKFAFKLARDAIVSQITWPSETSEGQGNLKETCIICYEDTNVEQMFSVDGCLHRFCFSCMKRHVEAKLLNGMEAKCPQEGCKSEVSFHTCGKFMDPKLADIMSQRKKEASIAVTEKVYCPFQSCSTLMSSTEVLAYTKNSFVGAENSGARKCMKCQLFFCIICRVPWHYNMTCQDYKRSNPQPRPEDALLNNLAKQKHWRQCVKCSHMVELAEGCYHITCRCGHEFCYICGAEWKKKKPTCNCRIWDEHNIIRDGRRRQ